MEELGCVPRPHPVIPGEDATTSQQKSYDVLPRQRSATLSRGTSPMSFSRGLQSSSLSHSQTPASGSRQSGRGAFSSSSSSGAFSPDDEDDDVFLGREDEELGLDLPEGRIRLRAVEHRDPVGARGSRPVSGSGAQHSSQGGSATAAQDPPVRPPRLLKRKPFQHLHPRLREAVRIAVDAERKSSTTPGAGVLGGGATAAGALKYNRACDYVLSSALQFKVRAGALTRKKVSTEVDRRFTKYFFQSLQLEIKEMWDDVLLHVGLTLERMMALLERYVRFAVFSKDSSVPVDESQDLNAPAGFDPHGPDALDILTSLPGLFPERLVAAEVKAAFKELLNRLQMIYLQAWQASKGYFWEYELLVKRRSMTPDICGLPQEERQLLAVYEIPCPDVTAVFVENPARKAMTLFTRTVRGILQDTFPAFAKHVFGPSDSSWSTDVKNHVSWLDRRLPRVDNPGLVYRCFLRKYVFGVRSHVRRELRAAKMEAIRDRQIHRAVSNLKLPSRLSVTGESDDHGRGSARDSARSGGIFSLPKRETSFKAGLLGQSRVENEERPSRGGSKEPRGMSKEFSAGGPFWDTGGDGETRGEGEKGRSGFFSIARKRTVGRSFLGLPASKEEPSKDADVDQDGAPVPEKTSKDAPENGLSDPDHHQPDFLRGRSISGISAGPGRGGLHQRSRLDAIPESEAKKNKRVDRLEHLRQVLRDPERQLPKYHDVPKSSDDAENGTHEEFPDTDELDSSDEDGVITPAVLSDGEGTRTRMLESRERELSGDTAEGGRRRWTGSGRYRKDPQNPHLTFKVVLLVVVCWSWYNVSTRRTWDTRRGSG